MTEPSIKWVRETLKGRTAFNGVTVEPASAAVLRVLSGDAALISGVSENPRRGGGATITQWSTKLQLDLFVANEDDARMTELSLDAIDALQSQTARMVGPEVAGFRLYECIVSQGRAWTNVEDSGETTLRKTYDLTLVLQRVS